jgi:hypothetical protein
VRDTDPVGKASKRSKHRLDKGRDVDTRLCEQACKLSESIVQHDGFNDAGTPDERQRPDDPRQTSGDARSDKNAKNVNFGCTQTCDMRNPRMRLEEEGISAILQALKPPPIIAETLQALQIPHEIYGIDRQQVPVNNRNFAGVHGRA